IGSASLDCSIGEVNPSARFCFSRLQHRRGEPIGEVPLLSTAALAILIPHSSSGFRFSPSPSARNLAGAAAPPQKYIIIADPDPDFATGELFVNLGFSAFGILEFIQTRRFSNHPEMGFGYECL
ncbi:hypothetical protein LINPERHAP2_LOCUS9164, partial [Linum perenne]